MEKTAKNDGTFQLKCEINHNLSIKLPKSKYVALRLFNRRMEIYDHTTMYIAIGTNINVSDFDSKNLVLFFVAG